MRLIAFLTFISNRNNLQVRFCFPSSGVFAMAERCLDPFVGVVECVGVGVAPQMSILISRLDGLTDC